MEQKKKALGKGLEQLFNSEVLDFESFESNIMESVNESDIREISVDEIRPNPYQPRKKFDQEALEELASSIKNYGVFQPIIVRKGIKGYDLVAGERRLRATKLAGLKTIPAIIKDFSDDMMREIGLLENLQRENLSAVELAWAYKGIIDSLNITQEELAERIGKSRSHVTNTLGLLRLSNNVQNMIMNNDLSMGHARVLSKIEQKDKIEELANKVVNEKLSVRDLENLSRQEEIKKVVPIKREKTVSNDYFEIENKLKEFFGTKVNIRENKMDIYFSSKEDLGRILEIMDINLEDN